VWLAADAAFRPVQVWDRYGLPPGWRARGPAVIEEVESTTVVTPGFRVEVGAGLDLVLTRDGSDR
jgi:N-methylhydantoinase A/oxoprolinase/acetone carboxylase beta subunit